MRSINTSIIGLLPVAGLLFVGAGILGVGTLEDLALVLFVGMLTGAYSSLFLATPWLVDLKLLDPRYKNHAQRVLARRARPRARRRPRPAGAAPQRSRPADAESTPTTSRRQRRTRTRGSPRRGSARSRHADGASRRSARVPVRPANRAADGWR